AEVILNDLRYVGVYHFIIGHTAARRVGQGDVAFLINFHQTGHAQHRIRPETIWIQEIIVNPPVNDVHAFEPLGSPHADIAIVHNQVTAFDQFDAHLLGEERVFEVS